MNAARLLILMWTATAAWADLKIRVVDPSGAVVQGAVVVLRNESGSEVDRGTTSASGVAEFSEHVAAAEIAAEGFRAETVSTTTKRETAGGCPRRSCQGTPPRISSAPKCGSIPLRIRDC